MTVDKLAEYIASFDDDVIPIPDLLKLVHFRTGESATQILAVLHSGAFRVGQDHLFKGTAMKNPFTLLAQRLDHRSGDTGAEALSLLLPYWAAEHVDSGQLPRTAILDKLDALPQTRLVKAMKKVVQNVGGLS